MILITDTVCQTRGTYFLRRPVAVKNLMCGTVAALDGYVQFGNLEREAWSADAMKIDIVIILQFRMIGTNFLNFLLIFDSPFIIVVF